MPRYSKQLKSDDCGPCAITNLYKWAGVSVNYKDNYQHLYKYLKVEANHGTTPEMLEKFLRKRNRPFKVIAKLTDITDLDKYIENGHAAVIGYSNKPHRSHVAIITKYKNNRFNLINHTKSGKIEQYFSSSKISQWVHVIFIIGKK